MGRGQMTNNIRYFMSIELDIIEAEFIYRPVNVDYNMALKLRNEVKWRINKGKWSDKISGHAFNALVKRKDWKDISKEDLELLNINH